MPSTAIPPPPPRCHPSSVAWVTLFPSQEEEVGVPSVQAFVQCKHTWRVTHANLVRFIIPMVICLRLPTTMRRVHPTFHVSRLKPVVSPHPPVSLMEIRCTPSTASWTVVVGAVASNICWTGRATVLRKDPGPLRGSSSTKDL